MKKIISLLMVTILLIACISGCASENNNSQVPGESNSKQGTQQEQENGSEPTVLKMWIFNDVNLGYWDEMEKGYNKKNPDNPIDLQVETYPFEEMHNKLQIAIQSGAGAPDIADVEISKFPNFLRGDIPFADLTSIVEPVEDVFVKSRFDIYSKDGKVYGLPLHVGATVMFYNKDILAETGVSSDDINTWHDFVEAGKKVKEKTGKPMFTIEVTDVFTFFPMIIQQGSDFFDKDGNVIVNNESNVKTLEFIYNMVHVDKIAIPTPGGNHHSEEFYSFFNQGGSAALMMPLWYMLRFVNYMPQIEGKIEIKPVPRWTEDGDRSAGMGGTGTVALKSSPVLDTAMSFLEYSKLSVEAQEAVWTILGFDPPRLDVWDSEVTRQENQFTEYFKQDIFAVLREVKDEIDSPNVVEGYAEMCDLVRQELMFSVISEQTKTPKEALDELASAINKYKQ